MSSSPAVRARPTTPSVSPASIMCGKIVMTSTFTALFLALLRCGGSFLASLRIGGSTPFAVHLQQSLRRPHRDAFRRKVYRANLFRKRNQYLAPPASHD